MPSLVTLSRALPALALLVATVGCATPPPASDQEGLAEYHETNDPLEPTNRFFYRINDGLDTYLLRPVAVAYRYVPSEIRDPIHNVLTNVSSPVVFVNDVMQTKPRRAGDTFMRFLINTTVGVGGLFDVANGLGYKRHDSDFGITLALWGVGTGPFLYLPVLGPSDPRDATGFGADVAFDPFTWVTFGGINAFNTTDYLAGAIDTRERLIDPIDQVKKTALDPYATFRSLYRQNRQSQIDETRDDDRATVPAWFPQH